MFTRILDRIAGPAGWRALLAAFALGALAALALPPVHAVPVLLLSIPGLLALLGAARGWRRAAALGFAWGWGHHLAGVYWVTHAVRLVAATWWTRNMRAPAAAASAVAASVPSSRSVTSTPRVSPTKSLLLKAMSTGHPVLTRSPTCRNRSRPWKVFLPKS